MIFDSNRAWQQAAATIRTNREVLFALSGVFYLLPILAFSLLFPQPTPPAGADEQAMVQYAAQYYSQTLPIALPFALFQAGGTLALLTLMTDRARPTVGQAIRLGFVGMPFYIASQLLFGFAFGLFALITLGLLGLTGAKAAVSAGLLLVIALGIYLWVRTSLAAPAVAVEQVRNPWRALARSWALTRGVGMRVLVFYALIVLVFLILLSVVMTVLGIVLSLLMPAKPAMIVAAVVSAALQSTMGLIFVAALAATHAQLAGDPVERLDATFE